MADVESDAERESSLNWLSEIFSTRLNDPKRSAIVLIMQRLHEEDATGSTLSGPDGREWVHFMVPMEYDWGRHCVTVIGWNDPRGCDDQGEPLVLQVPQDPYRVPRDEAAAIELDEVRQGELMWPERFGEPEVRLLKQRLGPYRASGRLQQRPTPDEGGIFQRNYWQLWEHPEGKYPKFTYICASLDTAFTEKEENDPSALVIYGVWKDKDGSNKLMLMHAWRRFLQMHGPLPLQEIGETPRAYLKRCAAKLPMLKGEAVKAYEERVKEKWGLVEWTADTCRRFKVDMLLIEGKASGITAAQELQRIHGLEGWGIQVLPVHGDKRARAIAVQPIWSQLMVYAPDRDWAELVIEEMEKFPKHPRDDLTDASTQAAKYLRDTGFAPRVEESKAEEIERARARPKVKRALYPV